MVFHQSRLSGMLGRRSTLAAAVATLAVLFATVLSVPASAGAAPNANWSAYLNGPLHHSYAKAAKAISATNANSLVQAWRWTPPLSPGGPGFISSPTVYDGVIYIGASNGDFYALDESTGTIVWQQTVGYVTKTTCGSRGFASTATVAPDPTTGQPTVYVASATGYLYAFDAQSGSVLWKSVIGIPSTTKNNYFDWSSPAVANGKIYIGISSQCDKPLVRAGLLAFDQATGSTIGTYYTVPAGKIGGSIWSSPAVGADGSVYFTTGNGPGGDQTLQDSLSIVKVDGTTLAKKSSWQAPTLTTDSDFGGSPTLFSATLPGHTTPTPMVGACNKNGYYYALEQNDLAAGPVWSLHVGNVAQ